MDCTARLPEGERRLELTFARQTEAAPTTFVDEMPIIGGGIGVSCDQARGWSQAPDGPFAEVSAGQQLTCGLRPDGEALCWGACFEPVPWKLAGHFRQVRVSVGQACGIRDDGALVCWGTNGIWPRPGPYVEVSGSLFLTCALRADGEVECDGSSVAADNVPAGPFVAVTAGSQHACALDAEGRVTCWGKDRWDILSPPEGTFVAIEAGRTFTCGLREGGAVECWGGIRHGNGGANAPQGSFAHLGEAEEHICVLGSAGEVTCWGCGDEVGDLFRPADGWIEPAGTPPDRCASLAVSIPVCPCDRSARARDPAAA